MTLDFTHGTQLLPGPHKTPIQSTAPSLRLSDLPPSLSLQNVAKLLLFYPFVCFLTGKYLSYLWTHSVQNYFDHGKLQIKQFNCPWCFPLLEHKLVHNTFTANSKQKDKDLLQVAPVKFCVKNNHNCKVNLFVLS